MWASSRVSPAQTSLKENRKLMESTNRYFIIASYRVHDCNKYYELFATPKK